MHHSLNFAQPPAPRARRWTLPRVLAWLLLASALAAWAWLMVHAA